MQNEVRSAITGGKLMSNEFIGLYVHDPAMTLSMMMSNEFFFFGHVLATVSIILCAYVAT